MASRPPVYLAAGTTPFKVMEKLKLVQVVLLHQDSAADSLLGLQLSGHEIYKIRAAAGAANIAFVIPLDIDLPVGAQVFATGTDVNLYFG